MRKIVTLFLLFSISLGAFAQRKSSERRHPNLPNFEQSKFHFGFSLGGNSANFEMDYDLTTYDSLLSLKSNNQSGFSIGLISSMRLNRYFTLRFTPSLVFAQRNVEYVFKNAEDLKNYTRVRTVESTYVTFPVSMKFRSARKGNFATYILAGGNFAIDLSSQADVNNNVVEDEQVLKLGSTNLFAEGGFGIDFFLEYFKFAIEFKYSYGINDVFIQDNSYWAEPINGMRPTMFNITLHFEG
jgi:hypothetical protein